jgi:hypothetical protein
MIKAPRDLKLHRGLTLEISTAESTPPINLKGEKRTEQRHARGWLAAQRTGVCVCTSVLWIWRTGNIRL